MATTTIKPKTRNITAESSTLTVCLSCRQALQRHKFQKKEFLRSDGVTPTCHDCKRKAAARRMKQPEPNNCAANAASGRVADSGTKRRPNNFGYCNYIDRLFAMKCFGDIVSLKVFHSAKDVSESMAAIHGATNWGGLGSVAVEEKVLCLCIGDGSTPRTAVLAAFIKNWQCIISIDPALSKDWHGKHNLVRGLEGYKGTLESFLKDKTFGPHQSGLYCQSVGNSTNNYNLKESKFFSGSSGEVSGEIHHLVILCVHSHARFRGVASISNIHLRYGRPRMTVVSLPCCPGFRHVGDIGRPPDHSYDDDCVFSACRTVQIWNWEQSL